MHRRRSATAIDYNTQVFKTLTRKGKLIWDGFSLLLSWAYWRWLHTARLRCDMATTIHLHVPDEHAASVIKNLTQLSVKLWLIQQGRLDDLLVYNAACCADAIPTCQLYEKEAIDKGVYSIKVEYTYD